MTDTPVDLPGQLHQAMMVADHAFAATARQLIRSGAPLEFMAKWMLQNAASVCALIEPAAVRAEVMQRLIRNFPAQVQVAKVEASKTAAGVIVPNGAKVEEPTGRVI